MSWLTVDLWQPEDHARLAFDPDCPVCRGERLAGGLRPAALVSRRTQAVLAAAVLALSTVGTPLAVAAGPAQSGGADPPAPAGDPAHSPDFDPGGQSTELPFDAPPTPQVEAPVDSGGDDVAALEPEPATDVDAPVADAGDGVDAAGGERPPGTAGDLGPAVSPEAPAEADGTPTPSTPIGDVAPGDAEGGPQTGPLVDGDTQRRGNASRGGAEPAARSDAQAVAPAAGRPGATVRSAQAPRSTDRVVTGATTGRAGPGDRFHVVLPGESLWSIATDVLGDRATVARVAHEVGRLWELNEDRIATGNRDLLPVATRLRLR